ncbi:MAG: hypothetical protein CMJ46_13825, partial [Planctomyces sp.]|nr:hypothetical protein [Planctomyces sp.]
YHQGELLEQQSFVTSEEQSYSETLTFALETDKADQHHYEIRLLPNKDEFTTRNNQQHFTQQVLDNMIHALFIDHHPRWEFRFLHSALERDERIELQTILLNPPVLSPALDDDNQQTSLPFTDKITVVDEANQSLFAGQDLVILGDLSETTLREELTAEEFDLFWQQLGQFVSEEGKTLVLLPGEEMLSTWNGDAPVAKLSPLMNPQMIEPEEGNADPLPLGMPVLPTPIGYGTPFLQFGDQPEQNQQIWERLPGHFRAYTGEPKPAAEVVLNAFPSRDAAGQPAMAYQQFGQGQVVWLGLDSTWRWRRRVGDKYHHRFWGQMARWAIQNKLSVETELVRFGPERPEGIPNQPIRLHAHFSSTLLEQLPELNPQVAVFRLPHTPDEEPIFRLPLLSLPSRQQSMTAVVENLPEGDYEFVLETDQEELFPDEILAPYVVRPLPTLELTETTANRKLLEQLAAQTGGKLMELDQLDQIPDIIQPSAATETWQDETHLWTHPLWLTLFVTLLSSEWLIRKWNGLP